MTMKRSISRASRKDNPDNAKEDFLPGLPNAKWNELLEKEENNMFILEIRDEIIQNILKTCYDHYLKRQAVSFAVHCAYLAWVRVIGVYHMFKDPGDMQDNKLKSSWEPDDEPEPSIIDSWGSQCIKAVKFQPINKEKELFSKTIEILKDVQPTQSSSHVSCEGYGEEGEYYYSDPLSGFQTVLPKKERSLFSKTLSMSKESLLFVEPLNLRDCKVLLNSKKSRKKQIGNSK